MSVQAAGLDRDVSQNRPLAEAAYPISRSDSLAVPPLGGDFENLTPSYFSSKPDARGEASWTVATPRSAESHP
jgi:hypothetical protein